MTKITYETKPCGRCGGSGHYSFNQMNGTRCFGYGGSGRRVTPKGRKARDAVAAFKLEQFGVRPLDLVVGTRVRFAESGPFAMVGLFDVESVAADPLNPGRASVVYKKVGGKTVDGFDRCSYGYLADSVVVPVITTEQFARIVEFARTLKGVSIVNTAAAT